MTIAQQARMTVAEFLAWAERQPDGRHELADGRVIAMGWERIRHNRVKGALWLALREAAEAAGSRCEVFIDGATVVINEHTVRVPDAVVHCGEPIPDDAMTIDAPLIVAEVASPSSERDDTTAKLVDYFSVPSIRHYLIVLPEAGTVIHHARREDGEIRTRIVTGGPIELTPPGLTLHTDEILEPVRGRAETGGSNDP